MGYNNWKYPIFTNKDSAKENTDTGSSDTLTDTINIQNTIIEIMHNAEYNTTYNRNYFFRTLNYFAYIINEESSCNDFFKQTDCNK